MRKRDWRDHWTFDALTALGVVVGMAVDWQRGFHVSAVVGSAVLLAVLLFAVYRAAQKRMTAG
jgi:hypothetical protein